MSRGSFVDPEADFYDNILVVSKILLVYEEYSELLNVQSALIKVGFDVLGITTEYTLTENVLSFNPDVIIGFGRSGKVTTLGVGRRLREMTRWQGKVILVLPPEYKPNPQDFGKVRADMLLEAPVPLAQMVQVLAKMLGIDESLALERFNKQNADVVLPKSNDPNIPNLKSSAEEDTVFVAGAVESPSENKWVMDLDKPEKTKEEDLESLWKELTEDNGDQYVTGRVGEEKSTSKTVSFDLKERETELNEHELEALAKDLKEAHATEAERVSKYEKFTEKLKDFDPRQSLSKISTRKVQKDLASTWNQPEIESQDKARQEFTKALFRKK